MKRASVVPDSTHRPAALLPLSAMMLAGMTAVPTLSVGAESAAPRAKELATIPVEADADKADGYRATTTRVGKQVQDPHDIPQAVTTVTRQLMDEQQVGSLREALRNVSGLSFNAAEGGRSGDNMNLRGFYTFGDLYLDGMRDTAQYNRETFNLEQIDVLRGAGAMLFGRGQAGGVINQVSKTPLAFARNVLTASIGSYGYQEVTADLNKPISAGTALRLNLMKRDEGSWRSNPATASEPDLHRRGVAFSLGLNLDTSNRFWLNHYQVETRDIPDYGVSFDAATRRPSERFPASTFWGTDRSFDVSSVRITSFVNELGLAATDTLRTQLRVADYERSYWAKTPNLVVAPDALGGSGGNATRSSDYETVNLQSDYSSRVKALGMTHDILAGVEFLRESGHRKGLQNFGSAAAPVYRPYEESLAGNPADFKGDSYAIYAQDSVEFVPGWKATLGLRRDQLDANYSSTTSPALRYGEWSSRAALSWQPAEDSHYYLAWSDSFSPTADLYQLTVAPLPPERSQVAEIGAKWLLLEGDLALRAALYQATKEWERNGDFESTAAILTRKRRTRGFEIEAAGRLGEHWEVFAGLALMASRILEVAQNVNVNNGLITEANPDYRGQRARNTPPYTFNLWTTYRLPGGWKIGGGVEAKGERYGYNPSGAGAIPTLPGSAAFHPNTAPAYLRWDALVAYEQPRWALRLNLRNLFDKVYYDAVYDNGAFTVPGWRRSAILSVEFKL